MIIINSISNVWDVVINVWDVVINVVWDVVINDSKQRDNEMIISRNCPYNNFSDQNCTVAVTEESMNTTVTFSQIMTNST